MIHKLQLADSLTSISLLLTSLNVLSLIYVQCLCNVFDMAAQQGCKKIMI